MKLSALVVDDEPIARHAVVRLLREDPDIAVAGECGDGVSAVAACFWSSPSLSTRSSCLANSAVIFSACLATTF